MAHSFKIKTAIFWLVHGIDKHVVNNFIDFIVASVEDFVLKVVLATIFLYFARETPTSKDEFSTFNSIHISSVPYVYIVSSFYCILNRFIKNKDCNIS